MITDPGGQGTGQEVLTNEEINAVARKGESFRPVSGAQGEFAADVFARKDEDAVVVAASITAFPMSGRW